MSHSPLDILAVAEAAAIAAFAEVGRGKKDKADAVAVEAMRKAFDAVRVRGVVVIGEGEMDEAPMLYIGEEVGPKDVALPVFDVAVDPLEGTNLCAKSMPGAIATLAVAPRGGLLAAPDMYMDKIATGPAGRGVVDLDRSAGENAIALAKAIGKSVSEVTVVVLERPRHDAIIADLRRVGARVSLISDGDVSPAVAAGLPGTGIDMMLGIGGAPEGVLAAAALAALGGEFQGRLQVENDTQRDRARAMGMADPSAKLALRDIVRGECTFAAAGVTTGSFLRGVRIEPDRAVVHGVVIDSASKTLRWVESVHLRG